MTDQPVKEKRYSGRTKAEWDALQKRYAWPSPEDDGGDDGEFTLHNRLLIEFDAHPDRANEFAREAVFGWCNEWLAKEGKPQWEKPKFFQDFAYAVREFEAEFIRTNSHAEWQRIRAAARRHYKLMETREARNPGRQPSDATAIVQMIREHLGYSRSRAYELLEEGTTRLEDRRALAKLFPNDPQMRRPAYWEPKHKARRAGRPSDALTFRDYVMSGADDFEGFDSFLELLKRAYEFGSLPDDFASMESFIDGVKDATFNQTATAVQVWQRAKAWRLREGN